MVTHKIEVFDGDKRIEEQNEMFVKKTIFFFKHLFIPLLLFVGIILLTDSGALAFFGSIIIGLLISFRKKIFKKKLMRKVRKNKKKILRVLIIIVAILSIFLAYKYASFLPKQIVDNSLNSKYEKECLDICPNGLNKEEHGSFYGKGYVYISDEVSERLNCLCNGEEWPSVLVLSK